MGGCGGEKMKSEPQGEGGRPMCPPLTGLQRGRTGRRESSETAAGLPQAEGICAEAAES